MESGSAQIGPRSGGKILDLGFNIYFGNLSRLLLASAVIAIPLGLILIGINIAAFAEPGRGDELGLVEIGDTLKRVDYDLFTILQVVSIVVFAFAYLLIIGASYTAANEAYFSRPVEVGQSVRVALRRMHSLLWISLLTAISIALGLLALIVGAFIVYTLLAVVIPALLVEDLRGTKALRRSWRLVRNNGWRTFLVLLVAGIFTGLVQGIASIVGEVASGLADENIELWVVIVQSLSALALAFAASFTAVITTVIYYDLRIRKEGFDIELMTSRLESGEEADEAVATGRAWGEGPPSATGSTPPPPPPPPPSG
jgi:hypothetical protein